MEENAKPIIDAGDVVQLRSGSAKMVVTVIDDNWTRKNGNYSAKLAYWNNDTKQLVNTDWISIKALIKDSTK